MASISYNDIFSYFLKDIKDFDFAKLTQAEAYEVFTEYIESALGNPYISNLFSDWSFDSDIEIFSYEMSSPTEDKRDDLFVKRLLAKAAVVEWLEPMVNSTTNLLQFFGGKEEAFYSQANHLDSLEVRLSTAKKAVNNMIRDRGFIRNSYLEG